MNKTVRVKDIFFDIQRSIAPLQVTGAIPFDSVTQY